MNAQSLPTNVTNQVPEAKKLLFVKLPDRVLLIDPDSKMVSEIVMDTDSQTSGSNTGSNSATTGANTSGSPK